MKTLRRLGWPNMVRDLDAVLDADVEAAVHRAVATPVPAIEPTHLGSTPQGMLGDVIAQVDIFALDTF